MADRQPPHHGRNLMSSRVGAASFPRGRATVAPASTSVRRNLFQSQLTRRPTQGTSAMSSSAMASSSTLHTGLDGEGPESGSSLSDSSTTSGEIVVRDHNGEVELVDPPSPTPDELNEMALDERQESERERQRLADTIKYHQQRTSIPGQPEELLEAIRASLRAKVSALADDNWMYEAEDIPRLD